MVALRKRVPTRMTLAEFLVWNPGDPRGWTWQLIDGEPAAMAPGSHADAVIQSEVARLLGNHLVDQRSPCHVVTGRDLCTAVERPDGAGIGRADRDSVAVE